MTPGITDRQQTFIKYHINYFVYNCEVTVINISAYSRILYIDARYYWNNKIFCVVENISHFDCRFALSVIFTFPGLATLSN